MTLAVHIPRERITPPKIDLACAFRRLCIVKGYPFLLGLKYIIGVTTATPMNDPSCIPFRKQW